jgi:fibronectin-binding autotransporter adhesin
MDIGRSEFGRAASVIAAEFGGVNPELRRRMIDPVKQRIGKQKLKRGLAVRTAGARQRKLRLAAAIALIPFSGLLGRRAQAASAVWQNTGTDFNTGSDWSGGTGTGGIPGPSDNATFTGPEVTNPNLSASLSIQGLTFSSTTTSGYTLSASSSQSLTLTNAGTGASAAINAANTSGTNTISAPLILGGAAASQAAFTQAAGGTLTISANISSTNTEGLLINGAGTVVLSGTNSFTGATSITAGTLQYNGASSMSTGSVITPATGTTINLVSDTAATFTPAASGLVLANAGTYNISVNQVTGAGAGKTLSIANQTSGQGSSSASTINVSSSSGDTFAFSTAFVPLGSSGSAAAGPTTTFNLTNANVILNAGVTAGNDNGITVASTTSNSLQINGNITNNTARTFFATIGSGILTLNNTVSGSGANWGLLANLSGGTLNINNNTAFNGGGAGNKLNISSGTLNNTSGAAVTESSNPGVNISGSFNFGTLGGTNANNLNLGTGAVTLTNNPTITTAGSGTLTLGGNIGGAAISLTEAGSGYLLLSGASTYTGGTTINAGTGALIAAPGAANATNLGTNSALTVKNGATLVIAPTATGSVSIGSGALGINSGATIGNNVSTSTITNGGLISTGAATVGAAYTLAVYGTGAAVANGSQTLITAASGLGTVTPTLVAYNASNFTLSGLTIGATNVSATVTSQTANGNDYWSGTYTGAPSVWAISNGSNLSNWSSASTYSATSLTPGATTTVNFSDTAPAAFATSTTLGANMSIAGIVVNDTNGVVLNADGNTLTIGTGGITVNSGAGAVTLGAQITLGGAQSWSNASANTLTISGPGSNGVVNGGNLLTIASTSTAPTTISAVISGAGGITDNGAGLLTLSASDTYSGATSITAGTLSLTGSLNGTNVATSSTGIVSESSAGVIAGAGKTFTQGSSGTSTIAGANTYTGATSVNSGTLTVTGTLGNTAVTVGAATLNLNGASAISQSTLTVNNASGAVTENTANALGGTAALTQSNGTVTLSSANNFSGSTSFSGGALTLSNAGAIGSSALTMTGGTLNLRSNTGAAFSDTSTTFTTSPTINVDNNGSGTAQTLSLGAVSVGATTVTVSANSDNYTLGLGAATQSAAGTTTFSVATNGTTPTQSLTLASFTSAAGATSTLSFQGAGNETITGNITQGTGNVLTLDRSGAAGTLILQGTSNQTGPVTITTGTIQTAVATNAFGSTSGVSIGANGILALRGDSSAAFSNGTTNYPISLTASGATINVDQVSSAAAGTTLTLGTVAMNGAYALNTTGADGVSLSLGAVSSSSTTTNNIAFNNSIASPGTLTLASIAYTANTSPEMITFNGTGSTTVTGAISQSLTNAVAVTQNNASGTTILKGNNLYTGATAVNGGTLALGNGGSLGATAVTLSNSGSAFAIKQNASGTTNALTGSLTLGAGTAFTMADGFTSTFNVTGNSTLAPAGGTSPTLGFDIGGTTTATDLLAVAGTGTVGAGKAVVNFTGIGSTALTAGAYNFITAGSALTAANFTLGTPNVLVNGVVYHLSLSGSATAETVTVGGAASTGTAFWTGSQSSSWATQAGGTFNTNFTTDAAGTTNTLALPDLNTNVTFTANSATNLSTSLDQAFTINSLTFSGTGTSNTAGTTIAAGTGGAASTLTINAAALNGNTAGNGITVAAGSGANTISANVVLGASQTWTNNSANALTVSGNISGSGFGITTSGTGTIVLSGTNSESGATTVSTGTLALSGDNSAATGATSVTGTLQLIGNASNDGSTANGSNTSLSNSSALTLNNGATLQLRDDVNNMFVSGGTTISSGATVAINVDQVTGSGSNNLFTLGGTTNFAGNGTLNVSGANRDTLRLNAVTEGGSGTTQTFNVASGNNLQIGAMTANTTYSVINFTGAGNTLVDGAITQIQASRSIAMTLNQTGAVTLSGSNNLRSNNNQSDNGNTYVSVNSGTTNFNNANAINTTAADGHSFTNQNGVVTPGGISSYLYLNEAGTATPTIDNTSGGLITLGGQYNTDIHGSFIFGGTNSLTLNTNPVTLTNATSPTITTNGTATLTIPGVISGGGTNGTNSGIIKAGNGTLSLTNAANTYLGATTISGGTLALSAASSTNNISASKAITVASGATLSASGLSNSTIVLTPAGVTGHTGGQVLGGGAGTTAGSVTGSVTVAGGAIISAGTSVALGTGTSDTRGMLSTSAAETFGSDGEYSTKINAATGTPGTDWDQIKMATLSVTATGADADHEFYIAPVAALTGLTYGSQYTWVIGNVSSGGATGTGGTLATATNLLGNSASTPFALDTSAFTAATGAGSLPIAQGNFTLELITGAGITGENIQLQYTATPEPGTAMLVLAGGLPMLTARRRRRQQRCAK